jgi:ankyrin repeat protein
MVLGKFKVANACAIIVNGCVDTNLGYTLLGEADRRLQEDDVRGLQTILASDGQEKRGVMLVFACVHGASRCAKYLIKQGAMSDVDMAACGDILDPVTPITIAGLLGHWEVVDALVEGGAEVYAFDRKGFSALSVAASQYPEGNLESLLRRQDTGMHINTACLQGFTPLMEASAPAVPLLVEAGAIVNLETRAGTALFQACNLASLEDVKVLVENGADNRATSGKMMTPLMVAAEKGHAAIVKYLLSKPSTDINAKAPEGGRAIDFACRMGHLEVVKILVGAGSRIEADTTNEWSPLVAAIVGGDLALVKHLVEEAGVDVQRPALFCVTPLDFAENGGHNGAVAEYLQEVISQREQQVGFDGLLET